MQKTSATRSRWGILCANNNGLPAEPKTSHPDWGMQFWCVCSSVARVRAGDVRTRVGFSGIQVGELVVLVAQRRDHSNAGCDFQVGGLDSFDENSYAPLFKAVNHFGDNFRAGRVQDTQLRHLQDDNGGTGDARNAVQYPVCGTERWVRRQVARGGAVDRRSDARGK
jgi:hypothetical protein